MLFLHLKYYVCIASRQILLVKCERELTKFDLLNIQDRLEQISEAQLSWSKSLFIILLQHHHTLSLQLLVFGIKLFPFPLLNIQFFFCNSHVVSYSRKRLMFEKLLLHLSNDVFFPHIYIYTRVEKNKLFGKTLLRQT